MVTKLCLASFNPQKVEIIGIKHLLVEWQRLKDKFLQTELNPMDHHLIVGQNLTFHVLILGGEYLLDTDNAMVLGSELVNIAEEWSSH